MSEQAPVTQSGDQDPVARKRDVEFARWRKQVDRSGWPGYIENRQLAFGWDGCWALLWPDIAAMANHWADEQAEVERLTYAMRQVDALLAHAGENRSAVAEAREVIRRALGG